MPHLPFLLLYLVILFHRTRSSSLLWGDGRVKFVFLNLTVDFVLHLTLYKYYTNRTSSPSVSRPDREDYCNDECGYKQSCHIGRFEHHGAAYLTMTMVTMVTMMTLMTRVRGAEIPKRQPLPGILHKGRKPSKQSETKDLPGIYTLAATPSL